MLAFLQPLLYIHITPERVAIRNLRTGTSLSEVAELALGHQQGGKPRVLAVGAQAQMAAAAEPGARLTRPFAHPRHAATRQQGQVLPFAPPTPVICRDGKTSSH